MSQRELLAVTIKVFSLWFLLELFLSLASIIPMLTSMRQWLDYDIPNWAYFIIASSYLIAGLIIFKLLFSISNSVLEKSSNEKSLECLSDMQGFILQVSGLFFIITGLIYLPYVFTLRTKTGELITDFGFYLKLISRIVQISIGLWLSIHASWWVLLFKKLRGQA